MLRKTLPYLPKPIQKLDQKLLLNYPKIWETQLHLFAPMVLALLGVLCIFISQINISIENFEYLAGFPWWWLLATPVLFLFIAWAKLQYDYNGKRDCTPYTRKDIHQQFICQLSTFVIMAGTIALPKAFIDYRIASIVPTSQLLADGEHLDYNQVFFPLVKNETTSEESDDGNLMSGFSSLNYYEVAKSERQCCFEQYPFNLQGHSQDMTYGVKKLTKEELDELINAPHPVNRIQKYLDIMEYYLPEQTWELSALEVLSDFEKGTAAYDFEMYERLEKRLSALMRVKKHGFHNTIREGYLFPLLLAVGFMLTNIFVVFKNLSIKQSIILLMVVPSMVTPFLFLSIIGQAIVMAFMVVFGIVFIFGFMELLRKVSYQKNMKYIAVQLVATQLFAGILVIIGTACLSIFLTELYISKYIWGGHWLATIIFMMPLAYFYPLNVLPIFHKVYQVLNTKPTEK